MSTHKVIIHSAEMSEEMQNDAVNCATQAFEKYSIQMEIAKYIKKEFDKKYNPFWHCIVGDFGTDITYENGHFIFFYVDLMAIILFKSV